MAIIALFLLGKVAHVILELQLVIVRQVALKDGLKFGVLFLLKGRDEKLANSLVLKVCLIRHFENLF